MSEYETRNILGILKFAYPSTYRDMKEADAKATVTLWHDIFREDSFDEVALAVKSLICTRKEGYAVTIGEIKNRMLENRLGSKLNEQEAWNKVANACRNGLYGFNEEFYKLPEAVQQIVGSPEQLREWAMMDSDTLHSVVASNFMRSYRENVKARHEAMQLSEEVKKAIAGFADKLALPE